MAFLIFAVKDNDRAASLLLMDSAEPRPGYSPCTLNTESSGASSGFDRGLLGIVVSASHSERLAIR